MTGRLWGAVALAALVLIAGVTHWWAVHKRDVRITELEAVIAKRDGELIQAGQVEAVLRDAIRGKGRRHRKPPTPPRRPTHRRRRRERRDSGGRKSRRGETLE